MGANPIGQSARKYAASDSLFIKFQGPTDSSVFQSVKLARETAKRHGTTTFGSAKNQKEAKTLWTGRMYSLLA